MMALSLLHQAADRIVAGRKTLEVRRWRPYVLPLRDLALVANSRRLTPQDPVDPAGQVVAIVDVQRIRPWQPEDAEAACSAWEPGWLSWELSNIRPVHNGPVAPAKRRLYLIDCAVQDLEIRSPAPAHRQKTAS